MVTLRAICSIHGSFGWEVIPATLKVFPWMLDPLPRFELAPHVVGSWHVPVLPRNYRTEEWQTIASLLGIQTAAVGGFMYFLRN